MFFCRNLLLIKNHSTGTHTKRIIKHKYLIYLYFTIPISALSLKIHRGAFGYVALILLDSEEVIRRHYGHLDHEDAIGDWKKNLSNIRNAALG